jgi:putative tricarboxylic transport membrane protein
MTDRITGTVLILLAMTYFLIGSGYETDLLVDPLGPKSYPMMLGAALGLFSLYLLVRPDTHAGWHGWHQWRRQILALTALVIYGIIFDYVGFIVSSVLASGFLAWLMGARPRDALLIGLGASVLLYFTFNHFLGLPLPAGAVFGGR